MRIHPRLPFLLLALASSLAACRHDPGATATRPVSPAPGQTATRSTRSADLTALRDQLFETDRAFSRLSEAKGMAAAFHGFADENAVMLPMGERPVIGREAIRQSMAGSPDGTLRWSPAGGEVARSGDLGYTWGIYEFRGPGIDGRPRVAHGKYISVWKRQPDGSWRYVLDGGNPGPPPD